MTAAPIAPRLPVVGHLFDFRRNPLRFLCAMRERHGDVVDVALGPLEVTLVSHPDLIEDILITKSKAWKKDRFLHTSLRPVLGEGLLSSEGDFWRKQRRLAQPAFHRERIAAYAGIMVDHASRLARTWNDGDERDVHKEMMRLTVDIVAQALFGAEVGDHAEDIGEAIEAVLAVVSDPLEMFVPLLKHLPTGKRRRFRRAVTKLETIIYGVIEERRRTGAAKDDDLLSMLLHARDEDGSRMSDKQLRDECLTLFLAGHETTAINLSWTWLLLSRHSAAKAKLQSEIDDVLGDRPATFADLPRLRYTGQVIAESLRLYPPAWSLGREACEDVDVGGYRIGRGQPGLVLPAGRSIAILGGRRPRRLPTRTVGGRLCQAATPLCVLPFRRRASPVHRTGLRPARGSASPRHPGAELDVEVLPRPRAPSRSHRSRCARSMGCACGLRVEDDTTSSRVRP